MDELLVAALKYARTEEYITMGMLQRRLRIIFPTALRLLEEMKALGVIPEEPAPGTHRYKVHPIVRA